MDLDPLRSTITDCLASNGASQLVCFTVGHDYEVTPHPFDDPYAICTRCGRHQSVDEGWKLTG